MIEIPILKLGSMPCYDQILACFAAACGRRYEMLFAGSWGFEYRENASSDKVGDRIKSRAILKMNYLKRYHGIEVLMREVRQDENFIDRLEKELKQEHPVVIFISSFYFPWNEHYKTYDGFVPHAIMTVGIDREKQVIYCTDSVYEKQLIELNFDDFMKGSNGKYWILNCLPVYEKEVDVDEVVNYTILKLKRNTDSFMDIEDIRRFADALENGFDLKKEIDNLDGGLWVKPIIFNLSGIMADREDYAMLLNYLLEQKEDKNLRMAKEKMDEIALKWNQIRGLFLKGFFLDNPARLVGRIVKRIRETADLEEATYHLLEEWKENTESIPKQEEDEEMNIEEMIPVDIEELYDLQTFGIHKNMNSIVNTNDAKYYFYKPDTMNQEWFSLRQMKFYHKLISGYEYDSVKCNGQEILVKEDVYQCVMLFGYGDLSSYNEELEIQYADGTYEALEIEMPDAMIPNPQVKNSMVWMGRCGFLDDIEEHAWDVGLYGKMYPLKKKTLKQIRLPICPNMILLSISLGK